MYSLFKYITIIHFYIYLFSHTLLFSQIIQGHITDPLTGKGISNISIMITDTTVYTDSTGYYNIDISFSTGLKNRFDTNTLPNKYSLLQNYPNPFNPTTTIKLLIPRTSFITLDVFNILGQKIKTLFNEEKPVGNYEVKFDGGNLSSGLYFYRMQAGSFTETKKLILIK